MLNRSRSLLATLLAGSIAGAQTSTIDFTDLKQEIDGFGASSAGHGVLTEKQLDAAFSNLNQNQMGLSILRVEINVGGESDWGIEKGNAAGAKARGAKYVLATPWSPPIAMKTNQDYVAGHLKPSSYADYAAYLKSYRTYMGDLVDIISIQNEPNVKVSYLSCDWDAREMFDFVKNNAGDIGGSVMMPETFNFDVGYSDPALDDATASANFTHIGLHLYGAQIKTYSKAIDRKKKIWMTEHFFDPDDITNGLYAAKEILDCLNNQMNAYVWWYLRTPNCNLINEDGTLRLKGYVLGQFAKYVRPGSHRVAATYSPQSGITVMAFTGDRNVIIAVNQNASPKTQEFVVAKGEFANPRRIVTSSSKRLSDAGVVDVADGRFTTTLDAQSITTFVSEGPTKSSPPIRPANRILREGPWIRTDDGRMVLTDLHGRILRESGDGGAARIGLEGLPAGVYLATTPSGSAPVAIHSH
ncbi:MAG: glucuronoxylanase XynC [Fibrobacteria bacterium]|nr:glucuronoxylanase XynC [Fibrobacteria bacterium]